MTKQSGSKERSGWLADIWQRFTNRRAGDEELIETIELLVDIADPTIKRAGRYHKTLAESVIGAREYCGTIIENIPGPVYLDKNNYFHNHTVKALFASADQITDLIGHSADVANFKKTGYTGEAIALLTMSKSEKTIFGHQKHGELILRDVAQRSVDFFDHRLVAPSSEISNSRQGLVARGLEVLATVAMERITNARTRISELREKRDYLKGAIRILGGKNQLYSSFAVPDPEMDTKLKAAHDSLVDVEAKLEAATQALSYPEDSLRYFEGIMRHPAELLTVAPHTLMLNWMNVLVDKKSDTQGHAITLAEFTLARELQRYAVFVKFPV